MKKINGVWLPDSEEHLIPFLEDPKAMRDGIGSYQHHKLRMALHYTKNRRLAIDVGGHCGLWSMHLVKGFQNVLAFEPVPAHRECFVKNVQDEAGGDNFTLHPYALGEQAGSVSIATRADSSGDAHVRMDADPADAALVVAPLRVFDDLYPDLWGVDFVKLDCEGYELFALRGMRKMLERNQPCVIVEQKPGKAQGYGLGEQDARPFLEGLGARFRTNMGGDLILSWP